MREELRQVLHKQGYGTVDEHVGVRERSERTRRVRLVAVGGTPHA